MARLRHIYPSVFQVNVAGDPDSDLKLSPLWPLQQQLRADVAQIIQSDAVSSVQISRVWPLKVQVEDLFSQWRTFSSLTALRSSILATISPPQIDLSNDPALGQFQLQLQNSSHWSDTLPS